MQLYNVFCESFLNDAPIMTAYSYKSENEAIVARGKMISKFIRRICREKHIETYEIHRRTKHKITRLYNAYNENITYGKITIVPSKLEK